MVLPSSAGAGDAFTAGLDSVLTARPPSSVSWMVDSCQVPRWSALKVNSWWAWKPVVFGWLPTAFAYVSVVVSVTSALAVRPVTRVASSVTFVVPALYVSPSLAMLLWRPRSWLSADFSSRDCVLERRTSPEKREVVCLVPAPRTRACVRSVKTASASFWKVALVAAFTVGSSTTAAPALQLGTRATPATTEAAAAEIMAVRLRLRLSFLDFNGVPLYAGTPTGRGHLRTPCVAL